MIACMGGWCPVRERCGAYLLEQPSVTPCERICERGHEMPAPLDVSKFPQWYGVQEPETVE